MIAKTKTAAVRAVTYIRMSTNKQDESPAQQRESSLRTIEREGLTFIKEYCDEGRSGTTSKYRPQFQQMLRDAAAGKFDAVVIWSQSRLSREDSLDAGQYMRTLRDAGVRLFTRDGEVRLNESIGRVMYALEQEGANQKSLTVSSEVVRGILHRARAGRKNGPIPRGYIKVVKNDAGEVLRRVRPWEKFTTPKGWTFTLEISDDPLEVAAIRWAFDAFGNQAIPIQQIARELNQRGLKQLRGGRGLHWTGVQRLLRNAAYVGDCVSGLESRGKFNRLGEVITVTDAHPALIDRKLFAKVQRRLAEIPKRGKCPRREGYILTGILRCGHCGCSMAGNSSSETHRPGYVCQGNRGEFNRRRCEVSPRVSGVPLNRFVLKTLGDLYLSPANRAKIVDRIKAEAERRLASMPSAVKAKERRAKELRQDIEQAQLNLLRAKSATVVEACERHITEWSQELVKLEADLQADRGPTESSAAVARRVAARLVQLEKMLADGTEANIIAIVRELVERIEIRHFGEGRAKCNRRRTWMGKIVLRIPTTGGQTEIHFTQADFMPTATDTTKQRLGEMYAGTPIAGVEFARRWKLDPHEAHRQLFLALEAGKVAKVGRGGWLPVESVDLMRDAVEALPPTEAAVMRLRLALPGYGKAMTKKDIAKRLRLSRERVDHIEIAALEAVANKICRNS